MAMNVSKKLNSPTLKRWVFLTAASLHAAFALWMLTDPSGWFAAIPGVVDTGPYNHHLVRDVGIAFLTVAGGFAVAAAWPAAAFPILLVVSIWFVGHALTHVADIFSGALPPSHILMDVPGVFLPAILSVLLAFWTRSDFLGKRP